MIESPTIKSRSLGRSSRQSPLTKGSMVPNKGKLFVLPTPIGHQDDVTIRTLGVLKTLDVLACEDTRVTRRFLGCHLGDHLGSGGLRLVSYHEHNAVRMRVKLLDFLNQGRRVGLVSDGGMPVVSDPGYKLIVACRKAGVAVEVLPGASAVLTALVASGQPPVPFVFLGFLPPRSGAFGRALGPFLNSPATLILFEAPHRLSKTLMWLKDLCGGERSVSLVRELTKTFEEVMTHTLKDLIAVVEARARDGNPVRGACVLVVGPPCADTAGAGEGGGDGSDPDNQLDQALIAGMTATGTLKGAVEGAVAGIQVPRRRAYDRALELFKKNP